MRWRGWLRVRCVKRERASALLLLLGGCGAPVAEPPVRAPEVAATCPAPPPPPVTAAPAAVVVEPAPTPSAKPPREPAVPLLIRVGEQTLVVTYKLSELDSDLVAALALDGVTIYPPDCMKATDGLCGPAHKALRGEGTPSGESFDRGRHLSLLTFEERGDRAYAVFSATTIGSPECSTYAFWILRLDEKGVRVTPPLEGCFNGGRPPADPRGAHPRVAWTNPPLLWVENPALMEPAVALFTLNETTMTFTKRLAVAHPAN